MKRVAICIKIESVCHKVINSFGKVVARQMFTFHQSGVEPGSGFAATLTTLLAGFPLHDAVMQFGAVRTIVKHSDSCFDCHIDIVL